MRTLFYLWAHFPLCYKSYVVLTSNMHLEFTIQTTPQSNAIFLTQEIQKA